MPAEILENDHMMYVGKVPWHGLGTPLDRIATAEEAIVAAHLAWDVFKEPVVTSEGRTLKDYYTTIRSDTREPLGIVGNLYSILQNTRAFDFFDEVTLDPRGPKYVTAGSLFNGKQIWILAELPNMIKVTNEDVMKEYILLTNRHDGRGAVQMYWVPLRVVCNNTLTWALQSKGAGIKLKHIGEIVDKVHDARRALCIADENHKELLHIAQELVNYEPTEQQINDVICKLLPSPPEKLEASTQTKNARLKVRELVSVGAGNNVPGVEGTAWALYNGLTEYADHYKVIRPREGQNPLESRLDSNWWGSSADFKAKALEVCVKLVG